MTGLDWKEGAGMEQKLVSIVIPIYNVEKYLERCLWSIVNQSYRNLEIILVDDGSPDRCPEMCEEWAKKDGRIKVIHKQNEGLGMARNTGMEHANGQYICFFDSDDYVDERLVEKAYERIEKEKADIVVYGTSRVDPKGKVAKQIIPQTKKILFEGNEVQDVFLPDLIDGSFSGAQNGNLTFSAWSCMYSMDLICRRQWRFVSERRIISEDSYSLIWIYKHVQRVAVIDEPLYYYCQNENSLTQVYREDRFDCCKKFYIETVQMAAEKGYGEEVQRRIAGLFFSFVIGVMKQVSAAQIGWQRKWIAMKSIVNDELLQEALEYIGNDYEKGAKGLLFRSVRKKRTVVSLVLVIGKVLQEKGIVELRKYGGDKR